MEKKLFLFATIFLIAVISNNHVFGQYLDNTNSTEPAISYLPEVIIIPAHDSGTPGCEETVYGCYIPKEATVDVGGKVIFSNTDSVAHTFTADLMADGMSRIFDSGLINNGSSYEWIPTTAGEFSYSCMVHPWMKGIIFVTAYTLPTDTDNDAIPDSLDSCQTQPETFNGYEDDDGCPDVATLQDSDEDGIVNSADTCLRSPETFNGYEDEDGCPDNLPVTDIDGDLIIDAIDSCPTQAETVNDFQDTDGCPDTIPIKDSDDDGLSDDYDKCPIQSENINNYQDTDGCPDTVLPTDADDDDSILTYIAIGIGVAGAGTVIGIKLFGKGSGGKDTKKIESNNHDDQDMPSNVEVKIIGGIEE